MLPTTVFVSTVALINGFQNGRPGLFILTDGGPNNASNLFLYFLYQEGFRNFNIGRASAVTVLLLGLLFTISLVRLPLTLNRYATYEA